MEDFNGKIHYKLTRNKATSGNIWGSVSRLRSANRSQATPEVTTYNAMITRLRGAWCKGDLMNILGYFYGAIKGTMRLITN